MPLSLLGISGGRLWRTTRGPNTLFTPWQDLTAAPPLGVGTLPVPADRVACAWVNASLHICVLADRRLLHTMETAPNVFTGWGDADALGFPGLNMGINVGCAAIGGQLHVCVDGFLRGTSNGTQHAVWRSVRAPSGAWSAPREVISRSPVIHDIACTTVTPATAVARPQLEVLARAPRTVPARPRPRTIEALVRQTLLPTGSSSGEANMLASIHPNAAASDLPGVLGVATSGIGSELHIVLAQGGELFHTISGLGGFDLYGNVRTQVAHRDFGTTQLHFPACAAVGGNLHVCAIANSDGKSNVVPKGGIVHTIRLANGLWRNPESNNFGVFGDVRSAVPPPSSGTAPTAFSHIACAGF